MHFSKCPTWLSVSLSNWNKDRMERREVGKVGGGERKIEKGRKRGRERGRKGAKEEEGRKKANLGIG